MLCHGFWLSLAINASFLGVTSTEPAPPLMQRQFKHALAESERQEAERRSKQQNGDPEAGWELAGSSRRGAHSHQERGSEEKRSGPRETEQRRPDEGRRPMTTGGMREGPRQR